MLLNFIITPFGWTVGAFFLLQLFAFGKFILDLYTKVKVQQTELTNLKSTVSNLKTDLKENKEQDKLDVAAVQAEIAETLVTVKAGFVEITRTMETTRTTMFKELKSIEEKNLEIERKAVDRMGLIAQGLVKVETELKNLSKS